MSWLQHNKRAVFQSLGVFLLTFTPVILLTLYYDFSYVDTSALLFLVATLCCIFIAKNAFDSARAADTSKALQQSIAVDLAISSEQLYEELYKNSPVPYLILDGNGAVKSANTSAARILGLAQDSISGLNVFDHIRCDEEGHVEFILEKYRNGVAVSDEMVRVMRSDHRERWSLLSLFGFTNVYGQLFGLMTLVDITKQKKAEDAKSEFVSLASHQLRTPIAGMKWSAELLQLDNSGTLSERQQRYIDRLLTSVERMARLVDDFLRVSRFELGTFQVECSEVDPRELIEDVMAELTARVNQKQLTVKTFFEDSVSTIITDANLLRMIVTNLYSNATKYTRHEGTIHVSCSCDDDLLTITVADNGMGIPAEDQSSVFSKLFRASNAVRDVPDGTGLGLYIVREAVAVLKGQVTFTTTENVGTTFEVVLPYRLPEKKKRKKKSS